MKKEYIGMLGGGQLGMMFTEAAHEEDLKVLAVDPKADCSISMIADKFIESEYVNKSTLDKIIENCEVCTTEFENVPCEALEYLEKQIKDLSGQIDFQDSNKSVYIKKLESYLNTLKNKSILSSDSNNQINEDEINGVNYITQVIEGLPPKELRSVYDKFKSEKQNSILACITINEDKVSIIIGLTKDLTEKYDARILIKSSFDHLGSKGGGGRVDFAQAGGDKKSNINQAFSSIREKI